MSHQIIGNQLRKLRNEKGWTQAELADRVGIARVSVLSIEKGHFIPTIETALRISQALNVPVEEIFWLKEEPS